MNSTWEVIYQYPGTATIRPKRTRAWPRALGIALLALGIGGAIGPLIPAMRMEGAYALARTKTAIAPTAAPLPASAPVLFNPLITPDGTEITPVNTSFSLVIPTIGVNAPVVANVDPTKPNDYGAALLQGVAHASTSFTPDEDGTVYLFSHSTNYDWFVKDLNAVFYLLKNLKADDLVVVMYQGTRYTYKIRETKVVSPQDISSLVPVVGQKSLILETCWPPGSVAQRLLVLADLIDTL